MQHTEGSESRFKVFRWEKVPRLVLDWRLIQALWEIHKVKVYIIFSRLV